MAGRLVVGARGWKGLLGCQMRSQSARPALTLQKGQDRWKLGLHLHLLLINFKHSMQLLENFNSYLQQLGPVNPVFQL